MFTVYFGTKQVVVLAGYKSVKDALVSNAEAFGEREISPIFYDINEGHGRIYLYIIFNIQYLSNRKNIVVMIPTIYLCESNYT